MRRSLITLMSTASTQTTIMKQQSLPVLRGVVFDMDGTLTKPNLDFAEMHERCGVDRSKDILEEIATMPENEQIKANTIIEEMEEEGRQTLELMPGAMELISWLSSHEIKIALVTRNTRKSAKVLTDKLLHEKATFYPVVARDAGYPPKPDPAAMHAIADEWSTSLPSEDIVMVGDSVSNDIAFGKNAGVSTALLDTEGRYSDHLPTPVADFVMDDLNRLPRFLYSNFRIESPLEKSIETRLQAPQATSELSHAAATGDLEAIIELSKKTSFGINSVDSSGNTALIWATEMGNDMVVKWIIQEYPEKVDLDHRGYLGFTAVNRAARRGHYQILEELINAGANLDSPNDKLQYPLHCAAFHEHEAVIRLLLDNDANPRVVDRKGRTPAEDTRNHLIRDMIQARTM